MPRYRRLVLAILCALAPLPSTSFLVGDVRQGIPCRAVPSSFFERILDKRPHWRATTHRTAQWMQDPSRQPLASPEDSLSRPASHAKELLRSLAFDATSVNETLWLALLAVFWPFLVLWSMAMSSVRTVEEFIVLLNHIHGEQSGVPTVYVPQGKGPTRMLLGAATTPSSDSIDWTLLRLQVQLQDAVNKEDYATASSLQAAIKETEERSTNKLAKQLLKRTWRMRRERESKATKPLDASALEELIAAAVNEDDFERAAQLRDQLKDLSPSRSEIELLEMDVKRRAVEMFIEETFARQDPILNLTKGIEELVAREEYEEAALLSKELTELKRVRDRKLLMEKLEMSLKRQRQFELDQRIANVVRQEMNSEMKRREIKRYYQERYSSLEKQPEAWKTDAGREHVRQPRYEKFSAIERIHGKVGGTNAQGRAYDATWLDFFEVKGAVDFDGRNVGDQNPPQ